jgi:hypothetical protein
MYVTQRTELLEGLLVRRGLFLAEDGGGDLLLPLLQSLQKRVVLEESLAVIGDDQHDRPFVEAEVTEIFRRIVRRMNVVGVHHQEEWLRGVLAKPFDRSRPDLLQAPSAAVTRDERSRAVRVLMESTPREWASGSR